MLFLNFFSEGGALLETAPQGDASMPVSLTGEDAAIVAGLLSSPEASAALARLYLAGAAAGERATHGFVARAARPAVTGQSQEVVPPGQSG